MTSCFRCHFRKASADSVLCDECNAAIVRQADTFQNVDVPEDYLDDNDPAKHPNADLEDHLQYKCKLCNFIGTEREVAQHIQNQHPQELNRQTQEPYADVPDSEPHVLTTSWKLAQPGQFQPGFGDWPQNTYDQQDPTGDQAAQQADPANPDPQQAPADPNDPNNKVEVGTETTPAERFDNSMQDIADRAAAKKFSTPDPQVAQQIAQQYGLDPNDVTNSLMIVTNFGDYSAVNGEFQDNFQPPDGYVQVEGLGGHVDGKEALVPTDVVVKQVAKELSMDPELVYNMVKDRYGDDLPDKFHASVAGDQTYYLPGDLIGPQQQPSQEDQTADQAQDQGQGQQLPPEPQEEEQQQSG